MTLQLSISAHASATCTITLSCLKLAAQSCQCWVQCLCSRHLRLVLLLLRYRDCHRPKRNARKPNNPVIEIPLIIQVPHNIRESTPRSRTNRGRTTMTGELSTISVIMNHVGRVTKQAEEEEQAAMVPWLRALRRQWDEWPQSSQDLP